MHDPMTFEIIIEYCFYKKFNHRLCNLCIYVYITALHRFYHAHGVLGPILYGIIFTLLI